MNWKIKAVGKGFYKTTGPSRCRLWPWLWLRLRCWQWLWVKIIMSRAIKREPKIPICVVGIGCWKSLSAASKCRKTYPCDYRISKFSGGACPQTPLGSKALWALPILCPGVKLSCPPVQNLNEPPAHGLPDCLGTLVRLRNLVIDRGHPEETAGHGDEMLWKLLASHTKTISLTMQSDTKSGKPLGPIIIP